MALKDHISVPDSVTNLIASNISTNIRELEGAYTKVRAYSQFSNEPITEELAIEALKDLNQHRFQGLLPLKPSSSTLHRITTSP